MKIITLLMMLFAAAPAAAGPFGLKMGMTRAQVAALGGEQTEATPHTIFLKSVPAPLDAFVRYELTFGSSGLCTIFGVGNMIATSRKGTQIRAEFESLKKMVTAKYGPPAFQDDSIVEGSPNSEPSDFMASLVTKDRQLASWWGLVGTPTSKQVSPEILTIMLYAVGSSDSEGFIVLAYRFANGEKCEAEVEAEKAKNL